MSIEIRRGVIIGLGKQGAQIAAELENRLQRRHDGVPIIQSITLVDDDAQTADERAFRVSLDKNRVASLRKEPSVMAWLPDIEALDLNCRAGARLALLDLYDELGNALREILSKQLFSPQTKALMDERDLKIATPGMVVIDIYIVGNLEQALVSGMFIDLAYLVRKICDEEESDTLSFQLNGLFLLPQLSPGWDDAPVDKTSEVQANVYAALKELNYYMDSHPYRLDYPGGETVAFSEDTSPFEPGYCYLLGSVNEGIEAINSHDAVNMTAEWLYHILIAPIHARLAANFYLQHYGAGQAIGAYSSIGLSSLILPMRYVRDYCARRLAHALVSKYLLAPFASDAEVQDRTRRDIQNSRIAVDSLRQRLIGEREQDDQTYSISPQAYDAFSLFEYQALETTLIKHYDHRQGTILPRIKTRMAGNKQILETEARERLKEYTSQLFDDEPAGAIDRSIKFFDEFLSRVRKRRSELEGQIDHYEKERQQHHQKIKERRGSYFSAAQTFGNRPLIPGLAMIIAFLMIFGYTYLFLDSKLDRSLEAVIVIGAGVVAIALVAWSAYTWVGSTKTSFIQRYNFRLQTHRLLEQARLEADVLKSIETYALDIQREISGFRDEIVKLRALAQARWEHEQAWEQLLYEHPYFGLEKSVIDQADVEMYYNEVAGEYSKRHLAKLFGDSYEGNYQSWLKQWAEQELNAEQMWERLYRYCTDQAEVLKQHYIVGKIEKQKSYEQSQVREDIEEIKKHARPFLRTRLRGDLGEDSETPLRESVAVHFERDEEADIVQGANKVATALHSLQLLPNVDDFGERYRLSVVTARRGLPLYILPDVMNCRPSYRQARDLHLVHTTKGNIALPDLAESHVSPAQFDDLPFNLEPRQAIALAAAFNQFAPEAFEALHYQDAQASSSDNEQVSAAGYYLVYVDARQREIANQLGREPKKTFHYLGSGKAQACLALYTDQNVLAHLRAGIHDYLVGQRDLSPLTGELLDYIEHGKRPDPHKPENILQDWEVIELERALDILLAHLRPASVDA